jgi:hypothetical protein
MSQSAAQPQESASPAARRLAQSLERFGDYRRDYDFADFEDLRGLRDTLQDFAFEAHAAITELEADRG